MLFGDLQPQISKWLLYLHEVDSTCQEWTVPRLFTYSTGRENSLQLEGDYLDVWNNGNTNRRCFCPSSWRWAVASSHVPLGTWWTHWSQVPHPYLCPQRKLFSTNKKKSKPKTISSVWCLHESGGCLDCDLTDKRQSKGLILPLGGTITFELTSTSCLQSPDWSKYLSVLMLLLNEWINIHLKPRMDWLQKPRSKRYFTLAPLTCFINLWNWSDTIHI